MSVQSVDRAISILQVMARRGPVSVTEIGAELGIHKSTVFRLLATLEARGLVEQGASRGRYRLGYGVVQLAAGATSKHNLSVISRETCQRLAEEAGETVCIAVPDSLAVVSIDQVIGTATVTSVDWVGQRTPMHATAAGKVFLADMPGAELSAFLAGELERYTEHTLIDPDALKQELDVVRARGFSSTFEEHEIGLAAMGAPIRNLEGHVIAAVTISGPIFRINGSTIPRLAGPLMAAAAEISERNGYPKAEIVASAGGA
jgi:IclR family transcriptional regulator, acetate operon repressor